MKYGLYCIKDEKVGFLQVMQDTNDMTAIRNFEFAVNRDDSLYKSNKSDFNLYKIGEFFSDSGEVVLEKTPALLVSATSL